MAEKFGKSENCPILWDISAKTYGFNVTSFHKDHTDITERYQGYHVCDSEAYSVAARWFLAGMNENITAGQSAF